MRRSTLLLAAAALSIAAPAAAQTPAATWIHAGQVLDRPGTAPRGASTIVVENGRVVRIQSGFAPPPASLSRWTWASISPGRT